MSSVPLPVRHLWDPVPRDSVVTVVDAVNIDRQLHEPRPRGAVNEAQLQVAYADIVLLNKVRHPAGHLKHGGGRISNPSVGGCLL